MAKNDGGRVTIKGRIRIDEAKLEDRAKLVQLMRNFREAVEMAHHLLKKLDVNGIKHQLSAYILNYHYAESVLERSRLYSDQERLKLRKPQLYSLGKANENGNRNIQLTSLDTIRVKIPRASGRHEWVYLKVDFGEKYHKLLEELINSRISYAAGISISYRKREVWHVYLNVPLELYAKHFPKIRGERKRTGKGKIGHVAAYDLNSDRICMVIVSWNGELLDHKSKHFPEVNSPGFSENKARDLRLKALSELVSYAAEHGVYYHVAERLEKSKTKTKSAKANRKISKFALRELLQHLEVMVARAGGEFHREDARWTSLGAGLISRDLGLDVHTVSAYMLARRFIRKHRDS